jgi:serine/threonine protein phosphatase PrpC
MTSRNVASSALVSGKALAGLATYAGRSLVGGRTNNEDGFVCATRCGLFAVADGMGGHNAGEVASALALGQLVAALRERRAPQATRTHALVDAFGTANRHVFEAAHRNKAHAGMGCTLSAVLLASPSLLVGAHVGDSRVYRLRGSALVQLTRDHAVPAMPNVLTRAIGTDEAVDVDTFTTRLASDDVFLLCTDGVTNALSDRMLARLLAGAHRSPATAVEGILRAALPTATDNVTAVVLRIEGRS